jgi:hypothetical protein
VTRTPLDYQTPEDPAYAPEEIYGIIPRDPRRQYDVREVIARLVDGSRHDGLDLAGRRRIPEARDAQDASRELVRQDDQPPAKWPALRDPDDDMLLEFAVAAPSGRSDAARTGLTVEASPDYSPGG